jgi:soluble lytic murein transglycosylase-like protein
MPTLFHAHPVAITFSLALAAAALPACADCIDDAAAHHQVNADVLRAIGWQESRLQPAAIGRNGNGSVDVGAFQINSIHLAELARYGITRAALTDGCVSAEVAAWHYRRQIDLQGNGWQAVGAYHSRTTARAAWYANQIAAILMRWNVIPRGALPFPADDALAPGRTSLPAPSRPALAPSPITPVTPSAATGVGGFSEIAYLPSAR